MVKIGILMEKAIRSVIKNAGNLKLATNNISGLTLCTEENTENTEENRTLQF